MKKKKVTNSRDPDEGGYLGKLRQISVLQSGSCIVTLVKPRLLMWSCEAG